MPSADAPLTIKTFSTVLTIPGETYRAGVVVYIHASDGTYSYEVVAHHLYMECVEVKVYPEGGPSSLRNGFSITLFVQPNRMSIEDLEDEMPNAADEIQVTHMWRILQVIHDRFTFHQF